MNILVKDDGTPAICDFGSARLAEMPSRQHAQTPRYVPPEVEEDSNGEERAWALSLAGDVWSFAMTALEVRFAQRVFRADVVPTFVFTQLMSGRLPYFHVSSDITILARIRSGKLPARKRYEAVPHGVWDILVRCWARDPELRPTMSEVKGYLDVAVVEDGLESTPFSDSK